TTHLAAMEGGAFAFGAVIGWNAYFINRYRKDVVIGDLAAVIGAVGGSAILALFKAETVLFAYYGMGLAFRLFLYFAILIGMVIKSERVGIDWFLTGRGNKPGDPQHPMLRGDVGGDVGPEPPL